MLRELARLMWYEPQNSEKFALISLIFVSKLYLPPGNIQNVYGARQNEHTLPKIGETFPIIF